MSALSFSMRSIRYPKMTEYFLILFCLVIMLFLRATLPSSARPLMQISEAIEWSSARRPLGIEPCRTGNPIDDCWRCDPDWETNRKMLADCAVGFGRNAIGGRDGKLYVVKDSENDDLLNPVPGTLRYAVTQDEPLWIIFDHDMVIHLEEELLVKSYKTIDGRGFNVQISNGPCITLENVSNIIIHNIYIHDCIPAWKGMVREMESPQHSEEKSDGDGISIFGSRDVWIDHCTLANCHDGLIDAVYGSTAITISNNFMFHHNEAMLMGHNDDFLADKNMQVTIAFNFFGEGLVQRMPRCRHGYFHIVNNVYTEWEMYAIGGSANPTINSQGNVFIASDNNSTKEVTKREYVSENDDWKNWNWRSDGDVMLNGAFFTPSGRETPASYTRATSMVARPASHLTTTALSAGALHCMIGKQC